MVKDCEPKLKDWPWQMDSEKEAVALDLTERLSVITESQPLAAVTVRLYTPAVVRFCEPNVKLRPWQMDSDIVEVSILKNCRLRVTSESQPV